MLQLNPNPKDNRSHLYNKSSLMIAIEGSSGQRYTSKFDASYSNTLPQITYYTNAVILIYLPLLKSCGLLITPTQLTLKTKLVQDR